MGDKKDDKIIEFSAYKQNKTLVQELVDEDKKANEFFEKSFPNSKINITFHNDPISLRGSQTLKQREFLVKNSLKIFTKDIIELEF